MYGANFQIAIVIIGTVSSFCAIFGVWYKMDRDTNAKIDSISKTFSDQLAKALEAGDKKRARIYERIDDVKTTQKEDISLLRRETTDSYVPVKICSLINTNNEKAMGELNKTIQEVNKKVDRLIVKAYEGHQGS